MVGAQRAGPADSAYPPAPSILYAITHRRPRLLPQLLLLSQERVIFFDASVHEPTNWPLVIVLCLLLVVSVYFATRGSGAEILSFQEMSARSSAAGHDEL